MANEFQGLFIGSDNHLRCWWPKEHEAYIDYHDTEWGVPVADDRRLFEKLILEGFQAGLSWWTILRKRDHFREAFADFDFRAIAGFGPDRVEALMLNQGIVRNRKKIESTINNAQRAIELVEEFGSLAAFLWQFEPDEEERPDSYDYQTLRTLAATASSKRLSKELKKRGWSYVGPTTLYAFMQSMGLVNDHIEGCFCREPIAKMRAEFERPTTLRS